MAVKIEVPSVGESVTEGVLSRWLKPNGAAVKANEVVCELETDKATTEVRAPASGTLAIAVPEGQKVAVGAVVGRIEEGPAPAVRDGNAQAPAAPAKPSKGPAEKAEALLSPAARQLAADKGVDVTQLTGTGRGGRVTKEDVAAHLRQPPAPAPAPPKAEPAPAPPPAPAPKAEAPAPAPGARETRQRMKIGRAHV